MGRNVIWGEMSLGRNVFGEKRRGEKCLLGRNVIWGETLLGEMSWGETSQGETSFGEKRHRAKARIYQKF